MNKTNNVHVRPCSSTPYIYMHGHVLLSTEGGKHTSWVRAYSVHVYI